MREQRLTPEKEQDNRIGDREPVTGHHPNLSAAIRDELPLPTRLFRRAVPDMQIAVNGPFVDKDRQQFRYRPLPTDISDSSFRTVLKDINSKVTGDSGGYVINGDTSLLDEHGNRSLTFPLPPDRIEVLAYGLQLADQSPDMAKYILPAAVIAAHPFSDGNGRTSRVLHALLSRQSSPDISRLHIADQHSAETIDAAARSQISLGLPYELRPHVEERANELAKLPTATVAHVNPSLHDAKTLVDLVQRENPKMVHDFSTVYAVHPPPVGMNDGRAVAKSKDRLSLDLAGAQLARDAGVDPQDLDVGGIIASGTCSVGQFVDYVWDGRKRFAMATLECLGDNEFGDKYVDIGGQGMGIREHYLRLSNHLG